MCFPAAAPIAAALFGGLGLSYYGQKKAEKATSKTFNRERERQKAFEGEQVGRFEDSLASTQDVLDPAKRAAADAARQAMFDAVTKSAGPAAEGYLPGSSSAPAIVANASEQAGARADANTAQLGAALARLGGLTDSLQQNDINIGRNSQQIGQIGGFKRGSLNVLQAEMDAAKQKGATARAIGSLLLKIGSTAAGGALGGVGAGASGAATAGAGAASTAGSGAFSSLAQALSGAI